MYDTSDVCTFHNWDNRSIKETSFLYALGKKWKVSCYMDSYTEVILSGGHLNALSYVGVLRHVDTRRVQRWVGTSAGALISLLYVVGYTQSTIESLVIRFPFERLVEDKRATLLNIVSAFGLYDTGVIARVIRVFLRKIGLDETIDFETLYQARGRVDLVVTAYCVNTRETVTFSREKTPDMPVYLAVVMSMAIPFVFRPILHKGLLYIDGGVLSHVPFAHSKFPASCLVVCLAERQYAVSLTLASYTLSILDAISRSACRGVHAAFDGKLRVVMVRVEIMSRDSTFSFNVSSDRLHALLMLGSNSYTLESKRTKDASQK